MVGRAGISSKFYKCGRLEGGGNKVLQVTAIVEVFRREQLTGICTAVKLFRYPSPPSQLEAIFSQLPFSKGGRGGIKDFHRSCLHAEVLAFLHAGVGVQPAMGNYLEKRLCPSNFFPPCGGRLTEFPSFEGDESIMTSYRDFLLLTNLLNPSDQMGNSYRCIFFLLINYLVGSKA